MRPSSLQLDLNTRVLLAELGLRDLCYDDVSLLLGCSHSGARNYIRRLLEAGLVAPCRRPRAGERLRTMYRLKQDADPARLLEARAQLACGATAPAPQSASVTAAGPLLRDPLVSALFGGPPTPVQRAA